jgi:hypothetical protein
MSVEQRRTHPDDATPQEVERLQAEVDRLRAELARASQPPGPPPEQAPRGHGWRWVAASVVLVLVALLAPAAIVATWTHDVVSDSNRYVEVVTPLASDPAVQAAVTTRVTDAIFTKLDVKATTEDTVNALAERGLSPRATAALTALSTPLVNAIHDFVEKAVAKLVASPQFEEAWVTANRVAHTQLVAVLTGKQGGAVEVNGGTVTLDLAPIIDEVKSRLTAGGFSLAAKVPTVTTEIPLMQSQDITKAQNAFRLLGAVARALPILALLLLVAAVFIAPSRRKALVIGSLVVALSMVLLGLLLNGFRAVYLGALPSGSISPDAAGAVYDTLVGFIRLNLRAVLVVFLAVAVVTWVSSPWPSAVTTRAATNRALTSVRGGSDRAGLRTGAFGVAVYGIRTPLRIGVLGLALLVYILAAHPTGAFALTIIAVVLLVLLLVELVARPPARPEDDADLTAGPPSTA